MTQDNSNSTMEMGTSDQVLVATKRKTTLKYIIGGVAMLVVIGLVITLIVLLTGGGDAAPVDPTVPTTEGPSSPTTIPTTPTTEATTALPITSDPPTTEPQPVPLELDDIIEGLFSPPSFNATWSSGNEVLFRTANGDLVLYNVDTDTTTALIQNTSEILQQSSRVTSLSPDGSQVVLAYQVLPTYRYSFLARYTSVNIATGTEVNIAPTGQTEALLQNFVWGPSGTAFAFVYLNNIYYQASLAGQPTQITNTGELDVIYHGIPDWVYEEEVFGSNNAIWFSGDGSRLAYASFEDTNVRIMKIPQFGIPGSITYQYTHHREIRYPKAGTINPTVRVTLHDLGTNGNNIYNAPTDLNDPILKTVQFVQNNAVAIMWTNRVQTTLRVLLCTAGSDTCTQIYTYTETDGWIDNIPLMFNAAGNSFITILPQSVNGVSYKQIVQVTQGTVVPAVWTASNRINTPHTVLDILQWTSNDLIWYKATSVSDSAEQHIYTVNAAGQVSCFSCNVRKDNGEECLYNEASISTGGERIVINCAGPGVPQVFIYNTDGSRVGLWDAGSELSQTLQNRELPTTIRMTVPVSSSFHADVHIQVPNNYQSLTNVPLLVYVYGGPDTALVTKQWNVDWGTSLVNRWGIAIAHIDGRGSGLRGVSNMFALNRRLGTVEIEDQINVTRYLQDNLPWVDGNRTCIWGWSYGGYAASKALAEGGSVFRCAAAVAPVVDWRFYDTIYTERYMDLPSVNTEAYTVSSLLTDDVAEAFRNKSYFLIHGTADDNVHYQHAMLLSRLLQRRDVYFTQMSYTDEDHGLIGVRPHLYHALEKFLREHML